VITILASQPSQLECAHQEGEISNFLFLLVKFFDRPSAGVIFSPRRSEKCIIWDRETVRSVVRIRLYCYEFAIGIAALIRAVSRLRAPSGGALK
jgi:hypothetical protein